MHPTIKGLGNEVTDVFFNEFEKSCDRSSGVYPKNSSGDSRPGPGSEGLQNRAVSCKVEQVLLM